MASSPPTRRTNGTPASKPTSTSSSPPPTHHHYHSTTTKSSTNPLTALLPTPYETLLLALYPLLLLLGSLTTHLSPQTRSLPYNPTTQSYPPSHAPNYFALKSNIFNTYFVKIGWGWVSLAYLLFLFLDASNGPTVGSGEFVVTPKRLRGVGRWVLCSLWWGAVTQWFFGAALVDRGFRVTGGVCALAERVAEEGVGGKREFVTSKACKAVGGEWRGGHDISGHVFLLVLGSAFLGMELLPRLVKGRGVREERRVVRRDGEVARVEREGGVEEEVDGDGGRWGVGVPVGVVGLSCWMLLMTAAYFHTWFEKLTGLMTAFAGVFVVYFLPRAIPALRDVVGIPGI